MAQKKALPKKVPAKKAPAKKVAPVKTAAKAPPPKVAPKAAAKKVAPAPAKAAKAPVVASGKEGPRSASNGGHIPKERYAKDPKSVLIRVKERINALDTQVANAVARAETNGQGGKELAKLQAAFPHLDSLKKALG